MALSLQMWKGLGVQNQGNMQKGQNLKIRSWSSTQGFLAAETSGYEVDG